MSESSGAGRSRRVARAAVQLLGFGVGLALLAWAVSLALSETNREHLERLAQASPGAFAALAALTLASLGLNGAIFWAVLRPVRRLALPDVQAVNAIASLLNFLPFKLSLISRIVIHNRKDRLPLLVIGGWFAAVAAALGVVIAPLVIVTLLEPSLSVRWAAWSLAGMLAAGGTAAWLARALGGEQGLRRLTGIADRARLRPLRYLLGTRAFLDLHQGLAMVGSASALVASMVLRVLDVGVQAGRFIVAAAMLGQHLSIADAIMLAIAHFVIGVISPAGALGFREFGSAGIAALLAAATSEAFALVAIVVTAVEAVVFLAAGGAGLAWLGPGTLLRGRGSQVNKHEAP